MTRRVGFMKLHVGLISLVMTIIVIYFCCQYIYQNSCYIKYTIKNTGKSDKNHEDKEEALEKFNKH